MIINLKYSFYKLVLLHNTYISDASSKYASAFCREVKENIIAHHSITFNNIDKQKVSSKNIIGFANKRKNPMD